MGFEMKGEIHTNNSLESLNTLRNEDKEHSEKTLPHGLLLAAIISSKNITKTLEGWKKKVIPYDIPTIIREKTMTIRAHHSDFVPIDDS